MCIRDSLAYRRGGGVMPALYDGNGEAAVTFSNDGYVLHGDLFGRGKEDVIVYSGETAWVYSCLLYTSKEIPLLLTIMELYRQHQYMYDHKTHSVKDLSLIHI